MRPTRFVLPILIVVVWVVALAGFEHVTRAHIKEPDANPFALVGYSAALVALAGWMIQAWIAIRNSRKQHTMNVLLQTRMNSLLEKHVKRIEGMFPNGTSIMFAEISKPENRRVYMSVRWILNYYEFVATGIHHRDLDEKLMRDCMCTQLCTFCYRADDVIRNVREEDPFGRPSLEKARILKSLRKLQRRWQRKMDLSRRYPWWPI